MPGIRCNSSQNIFWQQIHWDAPMSHAVPGKGCTLQDKGCTKWIVVTSKKPYTYKAEKQRHNIIWPNAITSHNPSPNHRTRYASASEQEEDPDNGGGFKADLDMSSNGRLRTSLYLSLGLSLSGRR